MGGERANDKRPLTRSSSSQGPCGPQRSWNRNSMNKADQTRRFIFLELPCLGSDQVYHVCTSGHVIRDLSCRALSLMSPYGSGRSITNAKIKQRNRNEQCKEQTLETSPTDNGILRFDPRMPHHTVQLPCVVCMPIVITLAYGQNVQATCAPDL